MHAGNERTRIPAPVRMVRPDELPAATLGFLHPALTSTTTPSCSPPAKGVNCAGLYLCYPGAEDRDPTYAADVKNIVINMAYAGAYG
jgi:hypothetical protein